MRCLEPAGPVDKGDTRQATCPLNPSFLESDKELSPLLACLSEGLLMSKGGTANVLNDFRGRRTEQIPQEKPESVWCRARHEAILGASQSACISKSREVSSCSHSPLCTTPAMCQMPCQGESCTATSTSCRSNLDSNPSSTHQLGHWGQCPQVSVSPAIKWEPYS